MKRNHLWKLLFTVFAFCSSANVFAEIDDPCGGPSALIALINRPTVSDSACVAPYEKSIVELGYQFLKLNPQGYGQNYPNVQYRVGLLANNEFVMTFPSFIHQTITPHSGSTASAVGVKHEFGYTEHWLGSIEGYIAPPIGSDAFGFAGWSGVVNGFLSYSFNSAWSLNLMLGLASATESRLEGGKRFYTINPDLVLFWLPAEHVAFYEEIYGQTKTAPDEGSGFNSNTGIIFLVRKNLTVDAEIGQRINGKLGGLQNFIGAGMAIEF